MNQPKEKTNQPKQPKEENPKKKEQKKGADKNELFKECDLRVGLVTKCEILQGFDEVYSLLIDIGEESPRVIGTGLRKYVPQEEIANSKVVVFSNLKPKRFGTDFASNGMIMCASIKEGEKKEVIELIRPNENAKPGDRVYIEGTPLSNEKEGQISGGKFGKALENFFTNEECICQYNGIKMMTNDGPIKVKSLKNAKIS